MSPVDVETLHRQAGLGTSDLERKLARSVLAAAGLAPSETRMHLLTNSRLRCARACPRLHWFKYVKGYRPLETPEPLRFGTLMHLVLEAWWRAPKEERLQRALEALSLSDADPYDRAKASALITGYHHRWNDEPYETIAVETEFCTSLRNPTTGRPSQVWQLAGKIDAIVRDVRDGRRLVVEHKTSAEDISPGSEYWKRLRMDGQVSAYYVGAESLGLEVSGCLYDVIGKPSIRPLKATPAEARKYTQKGALYANQRLEDETPEEFHARLVEDIATHSDAYFVRGDVVRLEGELEDSLFDMWQLAQQMHEGMRAERHPRNPEACKSYGRTCPFFDVCTGAADITDETRFVRLANVHPELSCASAPDAAATGEK